MPISRLTFSLKPKLVLSSEWEKTESTARGTVITTSSPVFGLMHREGTPLPRFGMREADAGASTFGLVPSGVKAGDWLRVRLVIDFQANGGRGFGDVYFKNLTQGDPKFLPVSGLQDVNLAMGGVDASAWDAITIRTDWARVNSRIDNLTIQAP